MCDVHILCSYLTPTSNTHIYISYAHDEGINRLPPHSKNIRRLAETYFQYKNDGDVRSWQVDSYSRESTTTLTKEEQHPAGPQPCISLDTPVKRSRYDYCYERASIYPTVWERFLQPKSNTQDGWKFRLFPNSTCIPKDYILPTSTQTSEKELSYCNKDTTIPSNWTMSDHTECCGVHDPPRYTNVQMPFDTLYPHVPDDNPTGVYRLEFSALPLGWVNSEVNGTSIRRRVVLHLAGIESCFFVYMNGEFVGMGKDSRLPSEFDVTKFIHHYKTDEENENPPDNVLAIVVLKWCDGVFLEQQDHWRGMAGIHRSVYLYSTPAEAFIEDVFCQATITNLNEPEGKAFPPQHKGILKIQARIGRDVMTRITGRNIYYNEQIEYARDDDVTYRLMFQLYDKDWKPLFDEKIDPTYEGNKLVSDAHFRSGLVAFQVEVPNIILAWSDESPTLYRLRASLVQINPMSANLTTDIDVFDCKVGFRNIEISNRELLINGQPVLIKGVNRHDHSSMGGKTVSLKEIRDDLKIMKQFNFNAVRTAHYPNDPYLYDLADKLGLYVIDEANIECHGHYDMICREHTFAASMLDRAQRVVVRDQNHPSIIGWSLGNEAGYSMNHKMMYGWIKGYDSSRFVQYEGCNRPGWGQTQHDYKRSDATQGSDIVCPMYPTIKEMIDWVDNIAPSINETRPFIMCEYAHAMGNSSGSLSDYWKAIKEHKGLQGGFIWDWIDQGLKQETEEIGWRHRKQVWHKYGGDYGDTPHDSNFNCNGMISPERVPHPAMYEFKKCAQPMNFRLLSEVQEDGSQSEFTVQVHNGRYFTTLDGLMLTWILKVGGSMVKSGSQPFPKMVLPQGSVDIEVNEIKAAFKEAIEVLSDWVDAEIHLDVAVTTQESFRKSGHPKEYSKIASEQFALNKYFPFEKYTAEPHYLKEIMSINQKGHPVEVSSGGGCITLSSNGFTLSFKEGSVQFEYSCGNDSSGTRKSLVYDMTPNLFRAATDNDAVKQNGDQANDDSKPLGKWLRLGLDCLSLQDVSVEKGSCTILGNDYPSVVTSATIYGQPGRNQYPGIALAEKVASSLQVKDTPVVKLGKWQQKVTMHSNGCLFIETKMDLDESLKDLPRVGIQLSVHGTMSSETSFADGPFENYPDRRLAAHAGIVEQSYIRGRHDTYCVPQEQGNKMNMRWSFLYDKPRDNEDDSYWEEPLPKKSKYDTVSEALNDALTEAEGGILIVSSGSLLQYNLTRSTDLQVFKACHVHEAETSDDTIPETSFQIGCIYLKLDAAQRGLGTGSCGPQTLPEYQVNGGVYNINFWIKPIGLDEESLTRRVNEMIE